MDCDAIKRSLGTWLDGEASPSGAELIRTHVEGCPSCLGEKKRLEWLQASVKGILEREASGLAFEPFWDGVRQRILETRPWQDRLWDWTTAAFYAQRLAWVIPVVIVFFLGLFSLEQFFPGWRWGSNRGNVTAVDSIDGHGFNVAVFRESRTKTTVIWLFENQEDEDESSGESSSTESAF